MAENPTVYISFHDRNWALGYRYVNALRKHGFTVAARAYPGSLTSLFVSDKAGRLDPIDLQACAAMVVLYTPSWISDSVWEPNFTEFLLLAEDDPARKVIFVYTRAEPPRLPSNSYTAFNAGALSFNGVVERLTEELNGLPFAAGAASFPAKSTSVSSPAASITVFISYAHADVGFEQHLLSDLQAVGIKVWVDHEQLRSGTPDWEIAIRHSIVDSDAVIYIGSEDAMASGGVRSELEIAHGNGIPIHAIWARGAKWSSCAPFRLVPAQYEDARGGKYVNAVQALIASLKMANGSS